MNQKNEYYVSYTMMGRECQIGPYSTLNDAWDNWRGMKSFPSVSRCSVERGRDTSRHLIRECA